MQLVGEAVIVQVTLSRRRSVVTPPFSTKTMVIRCLAAHAHCSGILQLGAKLTGVTYF